MRLAELLTEADIQPASLSQDTTITALSADSRRAEPGVCFVAMRGAVHDGHEFIESAVAAGAVAVVCEDPAQVPTGTPCAVVADTRLALGPLAQAIQGWPARQLKVIGITGTNGKSTVAWLLRDILTEAGHTPALLGTIQYEVGSRQVPATTTTPDAVELAAMMAEMVSAGCTHLAMEVSSHALDQRRVAGIEFAAAVMTNLSGDHLDYHLTQEAYLAAKLRLFESLPPSAVAIVNRDDPAGETFAAAAERDVTWYGLSPAADVWARIDRIDSTGTEFLLTAGEREARIVTPLIGRHNVYNCLAASTAADTLGVSTEVVARALAEIHRIPGRLERVPGERPFSVFVDYAHTDDALANVLSALRPVTAGRLVVVFGCGGDRDRTKRPRMARVAQDMADVLVITSDNPRNEPPEQIIDEIVAGLARGDNDRSRVEPDRRTAIADAIAEAQAGDVVLIAGKGHETYQVIGDRRIDFDDAAVAAEILHMQGAGQ
ncbi:MAG: UDP-N-acetylmuramoyl-L-alanyl-D-glutamate--2,6-diaminopimelate ligase [Planctomycetota bacterium]|jgi:UDP-N-acetylmuramoyl-L-alanyl-D-glutamate--2,6-diaminopimelate ligase